MRYAILSDIHANLEALEVVLAEIDRIGVDRILCLGDTVGYNASPNECMQALEERDVPTLMGNHDAVACGLEDPADFNPIAKAAIVWTTKTLKPDYLKALKGQPEQERLNDTIRLVHGSLLHRDHYLHSANDIRENIRSMRAEEPGIQILFFGHTHYQVAYACDGDDNYSMISGPKFTLREDSLYIINPGSVGQPRDRITSSAFLVYDEGAGTVEFVRLPYDISACARRILAAGLPRQLADRLNQGW